MILDEYFPRSHRLAVAIALARTTIDDRSALLGRPVCIDARTCARFADATLDFLREQVPRNWAHFCDSVTDNFRVISPKNFRVMT
jgi:hypothetical protein